MQVHVGDFLSGTSSIVENEIEAFGFEGSHLSDGGFRCGLHDLGVVFCRQRGDAVVVILGNDQRMPRIKWCDIEKDQNLVIFVQLATGNLTADDLTENAIVYQWHGTFLSGL
jgi:hypothetical protein